MAYLRGSGVPGAVSLVVLLGLAAPAGAQTTTPTVAADHSFDVQLFHGPVGPHGFITLDSAHTPAHKQFALSLISNYQRGPFSLVTETNGASERFNVVDNQITSELTGAIGLGDRFELGVALPLTLYMTGTDYSATGATDQSLSSTGVGDLRVDGKIEVVKFGPSDAFLVSLSPGITVPTGDKQHFLGDKTVTGRIRAITELGVERFRAAGMVGFLARGSSQALKADVGNQFLYTVAAEYLVHSQVGLVAEWLGRVGSTSFVDANPSEIDGGMRIFLPQQLAIAFGGGAGLNRGIGSPQFRGWLALNWSPDFRDRDHDGVVDVDDHCPDDPEDRDGYKDADGCPDPDNDGDGIPDVQDKCPNDPEDMDQFQDEDGCPEDDNDKDGILDLKDPCPNAAEDGKGKRPNDGCPSSTEDQDGDGIPDAKDKCPDEPEDRDGFQDYDGCPDLDNDGDGIPDQYDACPNEPEDADGFEDTDGCPDPDNDKDGIPDVRDKCPNQPETLNGNRDDDGCPDPGVEIVRLAGDRVEVRERVTFSNRGGKPQLTGAGHAVVNLVAMLLRGHDELAKVRIDASADGSKDEAQARADAVVAALIEQGVEAHRLKAVGTGGAGSKIEVVVESRAEKKKAAAAGTN